MCKFSLCEPRFLDLSSWLLFRVIETQMDCACPVRPQASPEPLLDLVSLLSGTLNPCLSSTKGHLPGGHKARSVSPVLTA